MPRRSPVHRPSGIGDMQQRHHPRSPEAQQYRKLYADPRWSGPHGIRKQAFLRDLYTCQRCGCMVLDLLGQRLGRRANTELTTGDDSGDPEGIVTGSTLGKTAAGTAAITWDEIIDLEHSVNPAYRVSPKARYMFNDTTLSAVRKLKDGNGNYL